jgi:hypothetical protein
VTAGSLELSFHDVAVVVDGEVDDMNAFRRVLEAEGTSSSVASNAQPSIRVRLVERPPFSAPVDTPTLEDDERGRVRLRDGKVEAIVELDTLNVELRGVSPDDFASPSPASRAFGWALCLLLRELDVVSLHAAGIVLDHERAALIVGDSGAGKTTTALALMAAGCAPLSDDQIFVRQRAPRWELLSAPEAFRVTPHTLAAVSHLGTVGPLIPELGKYEFSPRRTHLPFRDHFAGTVTLLFPSQHGAETTVSSMTTADALGELMVASHVIALGGTTRARRHAAILGHLAESASPMRVDLGRELLERPEVGGRALLRLLDRAALR